MIPQIAGAGAAAYKLYKTLKKGKIPKKEFDKGFAETKKDLNKKMGPGSKTPKEKTIENAMKREQPRLDAKAAKQAEKAEKAEDRDILIKAAVSSKKLIHHLEQSKKYKMAKEAHKSIGDEKQWKQATEIEKKTRVESIQDAPAKQKYLKAAEKIHKKPTPAETPKVQGYDKNWRPETNTKSTGSTKMNKEDIVQSMKSLIGEDKYKAIKSSIDAGKKSKNDAKLIKYLKAMEEASKK